MVIFSLQSFLSCVISAFINFSHFTGLGKDMPMRPPSAEEMALLSASTPKQGKEMKRKEAPSSSSPEKKKPARRPRKLKGEVIPLTLESVHQLAYETKDEDEEEGSGLVHRVRDDIEVQRTTKLNRQVSKPLFPGLLSQRELRMPHIKIERPSRSQLRLGKKSSSRFQKCR